MIYTILHNKYIYRAKLVDIKLHSNNEFFIWKFIMDGGKEVVGFSPSKIYFGNKGYLWYSLLVGYFLPPSYNMNFHNAIGKECYISIDQKGIVRSLIPFNDKSASGTSQPPVENITNNEPVNINEPSGTPVEEENNDQVSEETELFG